MSDLLLVDVSHTFWTNWHATADQEVSAAYERTVEHVARMVARHEFAAICCDYPPYHRKAIAPDYKAQRDKPEPVAIEQFARVKDRFARDGYVIWQSRGFEADDIIAGACAWAGSREDIERVVVASNDKDLLQLVGPRCVVLSTKTGDTIDAGAVEAKFGVAPSQIRDLLALMGDKSDNVPGVPGVGPKKAAGLLAEFGDIECLLARIDSDPQCCEGDRIMSLVRDHRARLELARRLVTLRTDAAVDYEAVFRPRVAKPLVPDAEFDDIDERDDMGEDQEETTMTTEQETKPDNGTATQAQPPPATAPTPQQDDEPSSPAASSAALARVAPQDFSLALEPNSIGAAFKLATGIFNSRLYPRYGNAEAIWAVIIRGREMGLTALTALDSFHFFEGRIVMHAHLIIARAKSDPECEFFQCIESTAESCTYETKNRRNPKPTRHTYTIAQAKQAGLCPETVRVANTAAKGDKDSRGMWEKRPAEQLRKTCGVQLARVEYPGAALGLYCAEELGGSSE